VLVDTLVTMHGRRTFKGTRKVLASLADPHKRPASHVTRSANGMEVTV
jgi:hypothetical protein